VLGRIDYVDFQFLPIQAAIFRMLKTAAYQLQRPEISYKLIEFISEMAANYDRKIRGNLRIPKISTT
jgi:hypothetical protein